MNIFDLLKSMQNSKSKQTTNILKDNAQKIVVQDSNGVTQQRRQGIGFRDDNDYNKSFIVNNESETIIIGDIILLWWLSVSKNGRSIPIKSFPGYYKYRYLIDFNKRLEYLIEHKFVVTTDGVYSVTDKGLNVIEQRSAIIWCHRFPNQLLKQHIDDYTVAEKVFKQSDYVDFEEFYIDALRTELETAKKKNNSRDVFSLLLSLHKIDKENNELALEMCLYSLCKEIDEGGLLPPYQSDFIFKLAKESNAINNNSIMDILMTFETVSLIIKGSNQNVSHFIGIICDVIQNGTDSKYVYQNERYSKQND